MTLEMETPLQILLCLVGIKYWVMMEQNLGQKTSFKDEVDMSTLGRECLGVAVLDLLAHG